MPSLSHIHEYIRSRSNKNVFRCAHPDCSHFTSRELAEGKRAICLLCRNEFILTWDQLKNRVPRCLDCSKSNKAKAHRAVRSTVDEIIKSLPGHEDTI